MFDPSPFPRVYALPLGADFGTAFVDGLAARLDGSDPLAFARIEIIVNTRRMERRLTNLLSEGGARILPRITPIAALPDRFPAPDMPPLRPVLRRKLELMQLVRALIDGRPDLAPESAVASLTDSLCALFDEMQSDGVSLAALQTLKVQDASDHWINSLAFLQVVSDYLQSRDDGAADAEERQRRAVDALVDRWKNAPPVTPVIVAGSTGSRATTLKLMDAVSQLPQGALVLPGFDFELPSHVWQTLQDMPHPDDHPQARFGKILSSLGISAETVAEWHKTSVAKARNKLVSLALRPAPVTDAWLREGPSLGDLEAATTDIEILEAPSPRIEAQAIALRLRASIEAGQTAALVSPDRILTRQVTAALGRWGIEPDDSAGRPLSLSPPGRLILQIASLIGGPVEAKDLIILLKHPLTNTAAEDRGEHLRLTRELEIWLRRNACIRPGSVDLADWADTQRNPPTNWVSWVSGLTDRIAAAQGASLATMLSDLTVLAEFLAAGPYGEGSGELWQKNAGEEARTAIADLVESADAGGPFEPQSFTALVSSVLSTREVRDPVLPHPSVMIWGTLEARVQGADLVVLGGLNEGIWPEQPTPDPWLNRSMREVVGLSPLERRIGLSAHDFQQAVAAKRVVLSRATRSDDAATVPSRWLNRILNLVGGLPDQGGERAVQGMKGRGNHWVGLALEIDRHGAEQAPQNRPSPRPPVSARPTQLSVTDIRTLIRDPYEIYAKRILRLRRIDPLERQPDHRLRGTVLHRIVEEFLRSGADATSPNARSTLLGIADSVLNRKVIWSDTRRLWRARISAIADQFLAGEAKRQAEGVAFPPEVKGALKLNQPDFTLVGTADRIDRLNDGRLAIYDYKTGEIPSRIEMEHFEKQLLLEAVMAEAGGFQDIPATDVAQVGYIALNPSRSDRTDALEQIKDIDFRTSAILDGLTRLVAAYGQPDRGYTARRAVRETRFEGDFDQLARFGEWDDSDDPSPEDVS